MIQIRDFEWDPGNLEHIHEHGVRDYEVEEVLLFDKPIYYKGREGRYCAFGLTDNGRCLFIVFRVKGSGLMRVITARNMTKAERRLYTNKR